MEEKEYIYFETPSGKHRCHFINVGEIRFGPAYYTIELDGKILKGKVFGYGCIWHSNKNLAAFQEWLTTDEQKGPSTSLTLVNVNNLKTARISTADKGFIRPLKFQNDLIIFEKDFRTTKGQIIEYEIDINNIKNWA